MKLNKIIFSNINTIIIAFMIVIMVLKPQQTTAQPINMGFESGWDGWEFPTGGHDKATIVSGIYSSGHNSCYLDNGWLFQMQPATKTIVSVAYKIVTGTTGNLLEFFAVMEDGTYNPLLTSGPTVKWEEWSGDIASFISPGDSFWIFGILGTGLVDEPLSSATIPEPGTLLLLGVGLLPLLKNKKIKRKLH